MSSSSNSSSSKDHIVKERPNDNINKIVLEKGTSNNLDVEKNIQPDINANEYTPTLQRHVLTPILPKTVPPIPNAEDKKIYPRTPKRIFSYIFFWYLFPVMNVGYKRTLENEDLWNLTPELTVEYLYERFKNILENEVKKNMDKAAKKFPDLSEEELREQHGFTNFTIPLSLFKTLRFRYCQGVFFKICFDVALALNPLLTKSLINFVERKSFNKSLPVNKGVGYAIGTACVVLFSGVCINHFFYNSIVCGVQTKGLLTKLLLDKAFKLDGKSRQKFSSGKITSMMGTDLARIDFAIGFQPFLITFPIPVIIAIALLIVNIGVSALVGIGLFFIIAFVIAFSAKKLFQYRVKASKYTDERVGLVREVLNSIKMIKFYGWEIPYYENIKRVRNTEMGFVLQLQFMRVSFTALAICAPIICSAVTFLVLYAVHPGKSPGAIFSSVSLFNSLSQQVMMVPMALGTSIDAYIALKRVKELMACNEEAVDSVAEDINIKENGLIIDESKAIQIKNGEFKWEAVLIEDEQEDDNNDNTKVKPTTSQLSKTLTRTSSIVEAVDPTSFTGLHNISLEIEKGEFIIITGTIGSGKTSLLNGLSGFMPKKSGAMSINDSLLFCGYPWVQNATVKDNILFGQPYDAERYKTVIHACSLDADLSVLPAGDSTEVGERGITLSGGQKARLNLARAVYNDKNIILFDDVLSAVDARVGKHIIESCILDFLKGKTRLLVTHQLSLINYADRVIYLNTEGQATIGKVDELKEKIPEFAQLMNFSKQVNEEEEQEKEFEEEEELKRELSQIINEEDKEYNYQDNKGDGALVKKEERAVNKISWRVYKHYISLGIGKYSVPVILLFLLEVACTAFLQIFTNTWLSFWTEKKFEISSGIYIGIYILLCGLTVIFAYVEFSALAYVTNQCAKKLNIKALRNVLYTPMWFLDTTPMGRILNRFTKDTDSLDNEIGEQLRLFIFPTATVVGVIILCIIYLPWIAIAIPILGAIFVAVTSYYQASSREVKRLEAINRSLVYNNFNECLSGVQTIKAYKLENSFLEKNDGFINQMNEANYVNTGLQRFLAVHFDIIGVTLILIIGLLCVTRQFHIGASSTGLLLSYILQIVGLLSLLVRSMTQVENEMNSAERLIYYAYDLPQEAAYEIEETKPEPSWPQYGGINFNNVSMKYRPELPLVLKNLNIEIKPGEKIGICGRTGAGKSTIMSALYRLVELDQGSIIIDGVDVSRIGLLDLRSKLCIIPQDPVLFKGSIRKNLDPFGYSNDEGLWDSLRRAGLIELSALSTVKKQKLDLENINYESLHKFHLDQQVEEEGNNFSLGERQLIALARALVRNSKILILDEATSSVDYETDANINRTIRTEFSQCTVLCIAHRLNTIVKFDRILVMDKGEANQFGKPIDLFNDKNGIFREMCDRSQIVEEDFFEDEQIITSDQ